MTRDNKKNNVKKKDNSVINNIIDKEPNKELEKEYKIKPVDNSTRIISIISIFTFLFGLVNFIERSRKISQIKIIFTMYIILIVNFSSLVDSVV